MHELIEKSVPFEVKVNRTKRQFEGYASTFGNMDLVGDIIENGAFRKTIAERGPKGANKIKILWQHNEAFGMPVKMQEDEHGLWVVGQASDTQENKDRLAYMEDGVVDSMSIGFTIPDKKSWWEEDEDAPWGMVRHIQEVKLYEFSPVTFPANESAAIATVRKHAEMNMLLKSFGREGILKTATELKDIEVSVLDEAIEALTKLAQEITGEKRAPILGIQPPTHSGEIANSSVGSDHITSGSVGTEESKDEPPEIDTDDPEVEKALQSWLEEVELKNYLLERSS